MPGSNFGTGWNGWPISTIAKCWARIDGPYVTNQSHSLQTELTGHHIRNMHCTQRCAPLGDPFIPLFYSTRYFKIFF